MAETEYPCLQPSSVLHRNGEVAHVALWGELVLIPLSSSVGELQAEVHRLNETAAEIWLTLDGNLTLDEVAAAVSGRAHCPREAVREQTLQLAASLVAAGLADVRAG
jgi:hypothetical protein